MTKRTDLSRCKMFIRNQFKKHDCIGIECECMFNMAADAGLYVKGTYGTDMSKALEELCDVHHRHDENGAWIYNVFVLKEDEDA